MAARTFLVALIVLIVALPMKANTDPKEHVHPAVIVQLVTDSRKAPPNCQNYQNQVADAVRGMKNLPAWRIAVTCDETMWQFIKQRAGALQTNWAFSNPNATDHIAVTVIHGGAWATQEELRQILAHELEHIRCKCSLAGR